MTRKKTVPLILLIMLLMALVLFLLPLKLSFTFTEYRTNQPDIYYVPLDEEKAFQIRYVHSIFLTDVIESYIITDEQKIQSLSMQYEDVGIGLPGFAEEGESLSIVDGLYTLTYNDNVIDSFVLFVGDVDADLAFRYLGNEIDIKKNLTKGKSYTFSVKRLSIYQMMKGEKMNG